MAQLAPWQHGRMADDFIYSGDDVLRMLDALLARGDGGSWWDEFFASPPPAAPFLADRPDENLAGWFRDGLLSPGRVLELGCGPGRNARYMAGLGCSVDAIDFSERAIGEATERARRDGVTVSFRCCSIFDAGPAEGAYDLVYDSGCFHHLPPHRRAAYAGLVRRALKPGGSYGLVCFRPEGGSGYTDLQVYQRASLGGGLGYAAERLRELWDAPPFAVRVLRQMTATDERSPYFGADFLWALLAVRGPRT